MTGLFSDAARNPKIVYYGKNEGKHIMIIVVVVVIFLSSNRSSGLIHSTAIS